MKLITNEILKTWYFLLLKEMFDKYKKLENEEEMWNKNRKNY